MPVPGEGRQAITVAAVNPLEAYVSRHSPAILPPVMIEVSFTCLWLVGSGLQLCTVPHALTARLRCTIGIQYFGVAPDARRRAIAPARFPRIA